MRKFLLLLSRPMVFSLLLIPILLLIDALCYQVALPVEIRDQRGAVMLTVGSTHLAVGTFAQPQSLQLAPHDPLIHEYQLDGSDSVNNRDLDTDYLRSISDSLYYRLQAWMRDLDGTSRWRNLEIKANERTLKNMTWPDNGERVALPETTDLRVRVELQRPETPMELVLRLRDGNTLQISLDRNNRRITVSEIENEIAQTVASTFFPLDTAPFSAMLIDTLVRILLWAALVLLGVQAGEAALAWLLAHLPGFLKWKEVGTWIRWSFRRQHSQQDNGKAHSQPARRLFRMVCSLARNDRRPFRALHPIAWLALACSLAYVIWIARVEYSGEPHIYDASTYLFMARTFASGRLFASAPPTDTLFPGPFMVIFQGRWFGQYGPGTALALVPGIWLGAPWLVEPILGTLALLGIGLIAARLYDRRVATLAILLGCLSPFYSYLAASYLSHAIALFFLVWGLWALLRFAQGGANWNMLICGSCFGMATLTRDLVALLFIALLFPGIIWLTWRKREKTRKRLLGWLLLIPCGLIFVGLYLSYNLLLTGDLETTPRNLFFAGDTWGFGQGIGFYGQHTLAAGLVNLDGLLTSLQIDLFGWPFYFTLIFLTMPFLTRRAQKADWFLLGALVITVGSYVGYFYNGIYLGPRYLFEDLLFLLILSARGILALGSWGLESWQTVLNRRHQPGRATSPTISLVTLTLLGVLICCNLFYYLPRQATRYQNYTGLPDLTRLDIGQIYQSPVHHAVVVTDDLVVYQQVLFPLNNPTLNGDVVYAWGYTSAQLQQLQRDFPTRALYLLVIYSDGSIYYIRVN